MARRVPEPQSLYSGIEMPKRKPDKPAVQQDHPWIRLTNRLSRNFRSLGKKASFSDEQQQALDFLLWKVSPEDVYGIYKGIIFTGVGMAVVFSLLLYLFFGDMLSSVMSYGGYIIPLVSGLFLAMAGFGI